MTIRAAFFDPFSGASGDMILGALLDAGLSLRDLRQELGKIGIGGYTLDVEAVGQHGLHGTRADVTVAEGAPARDWAAIRDLLEGSALDAAVRERALSIFERLAEAEAKVHQAAVDTVHFHEVGGVDAIVDIIGACIGLALLGIERVYSGPPRLGSGFARSQHGIIPVPAPATAELLARAGAPTTGDGSPAETAEGELLTPTGAAILTTLAEFRRPDLTPTAIGYGFGSRELPWPNALRVWIGTVEEGHATEDGELVLETNIDDMSPQHYEPLTERLFAAGALDVWLTPIVMKKGRPAIQVSVLAPAGRRRELEDVLILNSTTLGVRATSVDRTRAVRRTEVVATRWGDVAVKLRAWNGRVIDAAPEYDDCLALARDNDTTLREVWNEAHRLGESYVGRRLADDGALGSSAAVRGENRR